MTKQQVPHSRLFQLQQWRMIPTWFPVFMHEAPTPTDIGRSSYPSASYDAVDALS